MNSPKMRHLFYSLIKALNKFGAMKVFYFTERKILLHNEAFNFTNHVIF